ncbi:carboxymuconolactone decarboxylase [Halobacteriovorax marinus]|uniref:Carboxymuconolactone decarboxylase n=1 Tax=Halobacteriovorax marinus TaxID=97084 RepID=A0A1Y5F7L6_9BACT|nr:carboxymuconolactone decarboxylase [Halobacteriovorax marinus]
MSRIQLKELNEITESHNEIFQEIKSAFGTIPNMFKVIGNSEAALKSMWTSFGALGAGKLGAKLGEQIAVHVAEINRCQYCLSAHTLLGEKAGVSAEEMKSAQAGESSDPRVQAALTFSKKLVLKKASISMSDIDELKSAGFDDEEVAEILAHVALNIFTNYTNVAFDVPIDFPKVNLS